MSIFRKFNTVKAPHYKNTTDCASERMPIPAEVNIQMSQNIGAPCAPTVAVGDHVKVGQKIGETDAFMSVPIHSSVSGEVKAIEKKYNKMSQLIDVITIKTDGLQEVSEEVKPPVVTDKDSFIKAVRESGLVGLGGATFPTHIKFNPKNLDEVDTLVINGAECEPFITTDYRTMIEDTDDILEGCAITMKWLGLKKTVMGIEDNKPEGIKKIQERAKELYPELDIQVLPLTARYPKGAEKVMIFETTGKILEEGMLPADLGVIVSNITSIAFVAQYLRTGMPLVEKRVTVDGPGVVRGANVVCPIGTSSREVIEYCGGYTDVAKKIVMGGAMMGIAISSDTEPVVKGTSALIVLDSVIGAVPKETPCINCDRCVDSCPVGLYPREITNECLKGNLDRMVDLNATQCLGCGCCSFICPAHRPLTYVNSKMAKPKAMAEKRRRAEEAKKAAEEAKKAAESAADGKTA